VNVASISRFVLSHKLLVVIAWVVVFIVAVATVNRSVGALSQDFSLPGYEGADTSQAIAETYGNGGTVPPLVPVVTLSEGITLDSPGVAAELGAVFTELQAAAPTARIASFISTGDRAFVSDDGRTTFGYVFIPIGDGFLEAPEAAAVRDALADATVGGAPVLLTGYIELETGGGGEQESGVFRDTLIAGLAALIVLAWVFGSFLALIPLLMAAVAIMTTFLAVWGVTFVADVNLIVQFLVALIGLGVAIDYALLLVTRWREEREAGHANEVAVQRAMETAGSAIVFSGTTVGVGLFALVVLPVPFIRSIGYGGMLIPLVSVVVAITLLPVLLATIGPRMDWPRLRKGAGESRAWMAWGRLIVRRRWVAFGAAIVLLGLLLWPALSLNVGDPEIDSLASSGTPRDALDALITSGIGAGVLLPFEVLATDTDPSLAVAELARVANVRAAVAPTGDGWRRGTTAIVSVMPAIDPTTTEGGELVDRVRGATSDIPGSVTVGGQAAQNADLIDAIYGNFPLMIGLIALATFVLLVRAFRSLLLPLKAVVLNIMSVGAAFGVMTFIWQDGHGAGLIWGYQATGAITFFIPLMVFAFLFGLSMDYEVFILARMREEYDARGDTDEAIVRGLGATGRLVTSAALILFFAFVALGAGPEVSLKTFATGLAAGILLDATIVRALLVPATVSLLGKWNWWLPSWLERVVPYPRPLDPTPPSAPAMGD